MQELNLVGNLTVAENIFIERLPSRLGFINYRRLNDAAREAMAKVGLGDIDPSTPVKSLGVGRQQMVEIAAGLSRRCRVLALDEPTASLTDSEVELLFAQIRRLKAEGVGIIYISHRIEEVLSIADRVTVLRDGSIVGTQATKELGPEAVIRMMVGRDLGSECLAPSGGRGTSGPARRRARDAASGSGTSPSRRFAARSSASRASWAPAGPRPCERSSAPTRSRPARSTCTAAASPPAFESPATPSARESPC